MMGVLACRVDTSGVGDGGGDSTGAGSSTGATSNPTTTATTGASADGTSTGAAETGPAETGPGDTSSGGSEGTTDPDTSGTDSSTTSQDSSSGEPPDDSYPSCMIDDDCAAPYTLCWPPEKFGTPNFCTHECNNAGQCPVPTSGAATPVCEGPPGIDVCVLDCSEGECPTGMSCDDIFGDGNFLRCTRA